MVAQRGEISGIRVVDGANFSQRRQRRGDRGGVRGFQRPRQEALRAFPDAELLDLQDNLGERHAVHLRHLMAPHDVAVPVRREQRVALTGPDSTGAARALPRGRS